MGPPDAERLREMRRRALALRSEAIVQAERTRQQRDDAKLVAARARRNRRSIRKPGDRPG
jgi:hypothetical protein